MPLRASEHVTIPVAPSLLSELLSGFDDRVSVLPEGGLITSGPPHTRLSIPLFPQEKEMWCWAACAAMVLRFFGTPLRQCVIAGRQLLRTCCDGQAEGCDEGCSVDDINNAFGLVGLSGRRLDRRAEFSEIIDQISETPRRPVVAGVKWAGGGGHVVVVSGWRAVGNLRYLRVNDPFYGAGDIRYDDLAERYGRNDNGRWTHTWLDFSRA